MAVATFEGIVKSGQICLPEGTRLPENAKVYVIVPNMADMGDIINYTAPGAEGDAAHAEETEAEEDAVLRSMRRRFKRTLEPEVW